MCYELIAGAMVDAAHEAQAREELRRLRYRFATVLKTDAEKREARACALRAAYYDEIRQAALARFDKTLAHLAKN